MLVHILSHSLKSHKRLVVPQLGAFLVKEPGRSIVFTELLKRDDGVLRGILIGGGAGELEAAGEIDRFVFEVRHAVEQGGEYPLPGLGTMRPGPNGTIAFLCDPTVGAEECAAQPADESPDAAAPAAPAAQPAAGLPGPDLSDAGTAPSPSAASSAPEPAASGLSASAPSAAAAATVASDAPHPAASPSASETPHRSAPSGPANGRPGHLTEAVRAAFDQAPMSASAKMAPDPSVRGLRYGKPLKSTDAYTYVDRPPRRRADRFLWIALFAAAVALGAIAFGFWRERREQRAEAEFFEQVGMPLPPTSGDGGPRTE